jgi:type II secretory pathway component GspD/PulD (secretin)
VKKERTELLIILTPTVIRSIREADNESQAQIRRLNLLRQSQHDTLQRSLFHQLDKAMGASEAAPPPAAGSSQAAPAKEPAVDSAAPAKKNDTVPAVPATKEPAK